MLSLSLSSFLATILLSSSPFHIFTIYLVEYLTSQSMRLTVSYSSRLFSSTTFFLSFILSSHHLLLSFLSFLFSYCHADGFELNFLSLPFSLPISLSFISLSTIWLTHALYHTVHITSTSRILTLPTTPFSTSFLPLILLFISLHPYSQHTCTQYSTPQYT